MKADHADVMHAQPRTFDDLEHGLRLGLCQCMLGLSEYCRLYALKTPALRFLQSALKHNVDAVGVRQKFVGSKFLDMNAVGPDQGNVDITV
jgi:hypothetical protein